MSTAYEKSQGHSADVRMQLSVAGRTFKIRQLGPDFIILAEPIDCPPAEGEIVVSIDGRVKRWNVNLPDGIVAQASETRITDPPRRNGPTA